MPVITIRTKRPKSELSRAAHGNVNRWVNSLIEDALGPRSTDWDSHFKKKRRPIDLDKVLAARASER